QPNTQPLWYHGGAVFSNSFLYVVFWGSDWSNYTDVLQRIYDSIQVLTETGYFNGLDQYGYGSISLIGYTTNNVTLTPGQIQDSSFVTYEEGLIASNTIPKYYSQVI